MAEDTQECFIENARIWLQVEDLKQTMHFEIIAASIERTQWGPKGTLGLRSVDGVEYQISSWNLASKARIAFNSSLIGQKCTLSPFTEKKLLISFL